MTVIHSQTLGDFILRTDKGIGCGDTLIGIETINGSIYNLYMSYCGYIQFYAIKQES